MVAFVLGPARTMGVESSSVSSSGSTSAEIAGVEPSASGLSLGWNSGDMLFMMRVEILGVLGPTEAEGRESMFATGARGVRKLVFLSVDAIVEDGLLSFSRSLAEAFVADF